MISMVSVTWFVIFYDSHRDLIQDYGDDWRMPTSLEGLLLRGVVFVWEPGYPGIRCWNCEWMCLKLVVYVFLNFMPTTPLTSYEVFKDSVFLSCKQYQPSAHSTHPDTQVPGVCGELALCSLTAFLQRLATTLSTELGHSSPAFF